MNASLGRPTHLLADSIGGRLLLGGRWLGDGRRLSWLRGRRSGFGRAVDGRVLRADGRARGGRAVGAARVRVHRHVRARPLRGHFVDQRSGLLRHPRRGGAHTRQRLEVAREQRVVLTAVVVRIEELLQQEKRSLIASDEN